MDEFVTGMKTGGAEYRTINQMLICEIGGHLKRIVRDYQVYSDGTIKLIKTRDYGTVNYSST